MLKKIIFVIFFCALFISSFRAQISVGVAQCRPVGEMGMVLKRQLGVSLSYTQRLEEDWRYSFDLYYFNMQPRLEKFPVTTVITGGNGTSVGLNYQMFDKYTITLFEGGIDRRILEKGIFSLYGGAGICFGTERMETRIEGPTASDDISITAGIAGALLRLGAEVKLGENLTLGIQGTRRVYTVTERGFFGNYVHRLNLTYYF